MTVWYVVSSAGVQSIQAEAAIAHAKVVAFPPRLVTPVSKEPTLADTTSVQGSYPTRSIADENVEKDKAIFQEDDWVT